MKEIYICDYCGKQFENDRTRCAIHEYNCEKNPVAWMLIWVTCRSAIKDKSSRHCNECRNDYVCINKVLVENKTNIRELIKQNEPYDYVNENRGDGYSSGYRVYTSTKNPNFSFKAKYE